MSKNNNEDLCRKEVEYSLISLFSNKIRIGIIGLGKAGIIKAKHFYAQGASIEILTKENYMENIPFNGDRVKIINKSYEKNFLKDKHIIIIAIDDNNVRDIIKKDCEELSKIYIDSSSFKEGMGAVPSQIHGNNAIIGANTLGGNPRGAVFLANKLKETLNKYDDFIGFTTKIRNSIEDSRLKKEVAEFICTDEFYFFYKKGVGEEIIKLFWNI